MIRVIVGDFGFGYYFVYHRVACFSKAVLESALIHVQDKVDISVYFKNDAEERCFSS